MKRFQIVAAIAALGLGISKPTLAADTVTPASDQASKQSDAASTAQTPVIVKLQAKDDSGVSGTATLTAQGNQTQVVVKLDDPKSTVAQPAHFHAGTCAKLDPKPMYPLSDVIDGRSTSMVSASVLELVSGKYAINVHKSAADVKISVACGDVKG